MASKAESLTIQALRSQLEYVVTHIKPDLYTVSLFSAFVISQEEMQKIEQTRRNVGQIGEARDLLAVLFTKTDGQMEEFVEMVRELEGHVWEKVEEARIGIETGDVRLHRGFDVNVLAESLRTMYREKDEWRHLEPIPGERITLDVGENQGLFMKPVFDTQIVDKGKQDIFNISTDNDPKYNDIKCDNLQDIFELSKQTSNDKKIIQMSKNNMIHNNLLTVAGVAGVGKTTAMHRMVWDWASKMGKIHDTYALVFLIPVRKTKVEKDQNIFEILVNLGFLPHQEKEAFLEHMSDPQCAGKVLFIFDGADETELHQGIAQVILGEMYPDSTVVVTMRPGAESVKSLGALKPIIAVTMQGTDEESVHKFIHEVLKDKEASQVEALYQRCKEGMSDFNLLCIPLYLMLICLVFREESLNISKLTIPSTATDLFHMIFHVIINRWIERTVGKIGSVTFRKSPLEPESNIPTEIKRTLLSISNMCYNAICDNKYEFRQSDLDQFCLSSNDIVKSGLFHVSGSGENLLIYLKHMQLQEYLAAMYLTYQGHKTTPCSHIFKPNENKQSLVLTVGAENLIKTIQFCCGMSQRFCQYIFTNAMKCCMIEKTRAGSVDVYYEASLVFESQSEEFIAKFQRYLLQSEIYEGSEYYSNSTLSKMLLCQKSISYVTKSYSAGFAKHLLERLYDLEINHQSSNLYQIKHAKHAKAIMTIHESKGLQLAICLDQLMIELLDKFTFPHVETVQVRTRDTAYIDMCVITDIFPSVKYLDITGRNTVSYKCVREADTNTQVTRSKLTHMAIHSCNNDLYLPVNDLELFLHHPYVSSLSLRCVNILDSIGRGDVRCSLSALCELMLWLSTPHTESSSVTGLCKLLESCPHLQTLKLYVEFSEDVDVTPAIPQISHMAHLTHLYIRMKPARHTHAVLYSVSELPRLSHLSTFVRYIEGVEEKVTRALCRSRSLRSLQLWDWLHMESEPTGYTFPLHCAHTLRKHKITVSVENHHYFNPMDHTVKTLF